jgi:hypothetical protein
MMTWSKSIFVFLFILVLLGPLSVKGEKAKALSITSTIESVTVFRDRALVKRVAKSDYQPGFYVFKIVNLPFLLLDESVRVSGSGSAEAKILDIKINNERLEESAFSRINELEKNQREFENQIQALADQMDVQNRKDDFLKSLLSNKKSDSDKEPELQKKGILEWSKMFDFLENNLNEIYREKRKLENEKAVILDKKAVIDHELSQQKGMREKERKTIEIEIEINHAGSLQIEASYIVPQVSWVPAYDIRFTSEKNEAGLTYQAFVRQETGEDWENIGLTLSTAKPMMENSVPELVPQSLDQPLTISLSGSNIIYGQIILEDGSQIPGVTVTLLSPAGKIGTTVTSEEGNFRFTDLSPGIYELRCELEGFKTAVHKGIHLTPGNNISIKIPMETSAVNEEIVVTAKVAQIDTRSAKKSYTFGNQAYASGGQSKNETKSDSVKEPLIQKIEIPTAGISSQVVATNFAIKQKETILSNNVPQKVTMAVETIPIQREYQTIPKMVEQSFLKAAATNSTSFPLLPGKVNIFYDESFVSSSTIPPVSANEKFTISIGEIGGIKVKRELVSKKTNESGLFSKKLQTIFEYKITTENFQKSEESITVIDQIPVSENKDIAIELLSVMPAPQKPKDEDTEKEKHEGVLKWLLQLKPLEKKTIQFKYSVSYPKKLDVYNLD